jgi:hypothetical protein
MAWARFNDILNSGPDLSIQDQMLLQHFYVGLSGETIELLDTSSIGSFLHLSASEGREILTKILENTPYTSISDDPPEDIVEIAPKEEPMIVEPKPLATPLEASTILQVLEPSKEEEIHFWKTCLSSRSIFSPILETPRIILQLGSLRHHLHLTSTFLIQPKISSLKKM